MTQIRYFDSQVFDQQSELAESEAKERGVYVRAFMRERGGVYKAEVVRQHRVAEVVYYGASDEGEAEIREAHRAAYPGVPFQMVGWSVVTDQGREQRKQRYDAEWRMTEVVVETLDARGELLVEVRRDPSGALTSRTEYEYDAQGELARIREYDGHGRLVDEQDLRG